MTVFKAIRVVEQFMEDCNRPYSFNEIFEKGAKEFSKAVLQNAVDTLAKKGRLLEKIYGKQKIYVIIPNDDNDPELEEIKLRTLNDDIKRMESEVKIKEKRIATIERSLKATSNSKTPAELDAQLATLEASLAALRLKATTLRQETGKMDPAEQSRIEQKYDRYSMTFRKRKRMCTDMIDCIMEGYPKTKKKLLEEVGIETDEDVKFEPTKL